MAALNNTFFETFFDEGINDFSDEAFEIVSFQGFDPKLIRKELIRNKWTQKELIYIITFFLVRGTNIDEKNEGKNTAEFNQIITDLKNKSLVQRAVDKKSITINRIIACMPEIVAGVIAKHNDKCRILCIDTSPILPVYLKFSSGGSLCQSDIELEHWITWAIEQDKVINPKNPNSERVMQFAKIQYSSDFISATKKESIRIDLDRLLSENMWIPACARRLSTSSDKLLTNVIDELSKTKDLRKEVQKLIVGYIGEEKYDLSDDDSSSGYEDFTGFHGGNSDEDC